MKQRKRVNLNKTGDRMTLWKDGKQKRKNAFLAGKYPKQWTEIRFGNGLGKNNLKIETGALIFTATPTSPPTGTEAELYHIQSRHVGDYSHLVRRVAREVKQQTTSLVNVRCLHKDSTRAGRTMLARLVDLELRHELKGEMVLPSTGKGKGCWKMNDIRFCGTWPYGVAIL